MEKHVKLVAILYLIISVLGIISAFSVHFILNLIAGFIDDKDGSFILEIISKVVMVVLLVCSIPGIICGLGLLNRKEWARILTIIISALNLLNFPIGTALGIYAIWTLVQPETLTLFNNEVNQSQH